MQIWVSPSFSIHFWQGLFLYAMAIFTLPSLRNRKYELWQNKGWNQLKFWLPQLNSITSCSNPTQTQITTQQHRPVAERGSHLDLVWMQINAVLCKYCGSKCLFIIRNGQKALPCTPDKDSILIRILSWGISQEVYWYYNTKRKWHHVTLS